MTQPKSRPRSIRSPRAGTAPPPRIHSHALTVGCGLGQAARATELSTRLPHAPSVNNWGVAANGRASTPAANGRFHFTLRPIGRPASPLTVPQNRSPWERASRLCSPQQGLSGRRSDMSGGTGAREELFRSSRLRRAARCPERPSVDCRHGQRSRFPSPRRGP
jgi:hypothetical protein